jgi:hypothetical protein
MKKDKDSKKPKKLPVRYREDNTDLDNYYDINKVASSMDCTGLVPSRPIDEGEADSYTELYNIPRPISNRDEYEES